MGCALAVQVRERVGGVDGRPRVISALAGEMEGESRTVGRREREEDNEEEEEGWERGVKGRGRKEEWKRMRMRTAKVVRGLSGVSLK